MEVLRQRLCARLLRATRGAATARAAAVPADAAALSARRGRVSLASIARRRGCGARPRWAPARPPCSRPRASAICISIL
eukprot:3508077-Prymnesium_polylepis.1